MTDIASLLAYPGGLSNWQLLWLQNVVLMFAQMTTGATLYAQTDGYAAYLLGPLRALTRLAGRGLIVAVHAVTGLALVAANLAFVWTWFADQGRPVLATVRARPTVAIPTILFAVSFAMLAVFGLSLYGHLRPGTSVPTLPIAYASARKAHRGLVAVVVALLGYHLFVTPRVSLLWSAWLTNPGPWGLLVSGTIVVWGLLTGLTLQMLGEWATGDVFGRWNAARVRWTAALGGACGLTISLAVAIGITPGIAALGSFAGWLAVAVGAGTVG